MEEADLLLTAGFSDARIDREVQKLVGKYKTAGDKAGKEFNDAMGRVSNTESFKASAREIDNLKKRYDPLYAASKRYEGQLKSLDRALKVGAISTKQHAAELARLNDQLAGTDRALASVGGMSRDTTMKLQQAGWQVGDFAVQVGAGTSAAQAFSQQAPQLLGAFGAWGAIAGAAVAVTVPIGAALLRVATDSETLEDRITSLKKSTDAYVASAEAASTPIDDLRARYGDLADEVLRAGQAMTYLTGLRARHDLLGAARGISGEIGLNLNPVAVPVGPDGTVNLDRQRMADMQREEAMRRLQRLTGATAEQADRLRMALNRTDSATGPESVVRDMENLLSVLAELSANRGADQDAIFGWAASAESIMREAQRQVEAGADGMAKAYKEVVDRYETDTERLKKLSDDRKVAQQAVDDAVKSGSNDAASLARERLGLIDAEIQKVKDLALANDEAFQAMQKRIKQGFGGWVDGLVEQATGTSLTQWGRDLTASQKGILDLIKSRESGGDYNVTLDNGRYTGGARDLVNMTIKEVLAMQQQMLAHPDNKHNSSAAGAYQITGRTLRSLVVDLNLTGDELFSREMQDRLATQLLRRRQGQGIEGLMNEWEGLRGVNPAVIQQAMGQQSIERVDPEIQRELDKQIKDRERLAEQAKRYGDQLQQNLITEQESSRLAAEQASQIAAIKSQGLAPDAEASAIAQVTAEIERQKTVMMLMADAKRRNVDLDAMLADGSMTYRDAILALGEAKAADIIASNDRAIAEGKAAEAQKLMASAQEQIKNGILDSIIAGESFADVLGNVAKMFAKAALEAALFNTGAFSTGIGGGLLGGLIGGLFGRGDALSGALRGAGLPARAAGGPVKAGQAYMVGELGPEPFVPAMDGRILSVEQAKSAISGRGSGGGSAVFSPSITIQGDASEKTIAIMQQMLDRENAQFISRWRTAQKEVGQRT